MRPHSRRCHRAKTQTWTAHRTADGTVIWTSPTGRSYPVPPLWQPPPIPRPRRPAAPCPAAPQPWQRAAADSAPDDDLTAAFTDALVQARADELTADTVRRSAAPPTPPTPRRPGRSTLDDLINPIVTGDSTDIPF